MLETIKKSKGAEPFIFRDRLPHEYYQKEGIPYHKRDDRYTGRRDEPLAVPIFIVKDRVYVGFNQHVADKLAETVKWLLIHSRESDKLSYLFFAQDSVVWAVNAI